MATLVLSTVGTAIAGPIGGLLGSLVGQGIDQQLLGGGPRKGPRLGDLSVQTSSYGTSIPRIYGMMRVAGTIVWATDLKENSELEGDGKSQPETVVYTYSASFAVALSCRHAANVRRIWADGQLIRGEAGDLKIPAKLRFYSGDEAQPVDPLIASVEGAGQSPAYRGLALAVFEDLQLATFGNRIPTLTFEIVADEGDGVAIGEVLTDAGDGAILCTDERTITGYAAHGEDIGSAIAPLVEALAVELYGQGDALRSPDNRQVYVPSEDALGANAGVEGSAIMERQQAPATSLPAAVALTYYDPSRDYQSGQSRVSSPVAGKMVRAIALPCALPAGAAKTAAESLLLRAWALRERLTIRLPISFLDIRPGALFGFPDVAGDWVAEEVEIEGFVAVITLRPVWAYAGIRSGDPGRANPQPDIVAAPTSLALFDLPDPETTQPTLMLAATSPSGGWRSVPVEVEAGGIVTASRTASSETVLGSALTALGDGQEHLIDLINHFDVQLANPDHWLQSRDDDALAMGANLASIGDELLQFGDAQPLAAGRFRLSRLLRGRRGSEWAMSGHTVGETFALIDARTLKAIPLPVEMLGSLITVSAHGPGDLSAPPTVIRAANGEAMRPLSPAGLAAAFEADGSLTVRWIRRSRLAWAWLDEVEAPPDPSLRGYRLTVVGSSATVERGSALEQASLSAAEISSLGGGTIEVQVRQVGTMALSRPATLNLNL